MTYANAAEALVQAHLSHLKDKAGQGVRVTQADAEAAVRVLLCHLGEDPTRDGLVETPKRVAKAMREMTAGLALDPARHLDKQFDCDTSGMVVVRGIRFTSMCEHHLLPFVGSATVGYIPSGGKVVGLSKLARVVVEFAQRPQVQERIAEQVADALQAKLNPKGIGVQLVAKHSCMACRGVHQQDAEALSMVVRGAMLEKPEARNEFVTACR